MRIETKQISQMNRAEYNPRVELQPGDEEYESIKYSIETYGLVQPIVWNERTNNIVSGHQRLTVLENAGETEVPVTVVDLDDIAEKQLNIALNQVRGRWDNNKLYELLDELGDEAKNTGFTAEELETMKKTVSYFEDAESAAETDEIDQSEDTFMLSITFDVEVGERIEQYMRDHGDKEIIDRIISTAKGET